MILQPTPRLPDLSTSYYILEKNYNDLTTMCMKATCSQCGKTTWQGCGSHISTALDPVPADQLCTCAPKVVFNGKEYPPRAK